jgi:hypothetical protein
MREGFTYDVFLSQNSEDVSVVREPALRLNRIIHERAL